MRIQKILLFVLGMLVVALPLFLNTATDTEFTFNKTLLFQLGILVILVVISFGSKLNIIKTWKKYKVIMSLLFLYAFVLLMATIISESTFVSFFGSERHQGFLQYLFYLSLVFIIFTIITNKQYVYKLIHWIIGGAALVSIVGILEQAGFRIFEYTIFDKGIASTLGHPSFLGAFIVMTIPLTVAFIFYSSSRIKKQLAIILVVLQIIVLYLTQTRGAWIALIVVALFVIILVLIKQKKRKILYLTLSILIIVFGLAIGTGLLQQVVDFQSGSGALRIIWAEQAVEIIKGSPWLGFGLDMQKDVLISSYDPIQGVYSYYNLFTDRVHNEFLDQALTAGLIGLGAYLAILIFVFIKAIKYFLKSHKKESSIVLALITGILAYLVQGMFSFSVTVLYAYLWIYISLVFVIIGLNNESGDVKNERLNKTKKYLGNFIGLIFTILIGIIIVRPVIADGYLKRMMDVDAENRFAVYEVEDLHSSIDPYVNNSPGEIPYRFRYVDQLLTLASIQDGDEKKTVLYEKCFDQLEIIKKKNPLSFLYDPKMGELMREWGKIDNGQFERMNQAYQRATINSPNYALLYYKWGRGLEVEGKLLEAVEQYLRAIELFADPATFGIEDSVEKHLTLSIASVYLRLSEVENSLGNIDIANAYHKKNQELIAPYISQ